MILTVCQVLDACSLLGHEVIDVVVMVDRACSILRLCNQRLGWKVEIVYMFVEYQVGESNRSPLSAVPC